MGDAFHPSHPSQRQARLWHPAPLRIPKTRRYEQRRTVRCPLVSFGTGRFFPARVCCLGWGTDFDDPCPARICVCPARPSTESRPVCHEPRRWWAMHSPRRISHSDKLIVKAPCASAYSNTRRYEPGGRCVATWCLSVPVSIDMSDAIHERLHRLRQVPHSSWASA